MRWCASTATILSTIPFKEASFENSMKEKFFPASTFRISGGPT
jgi:hypothetical protein